MAFTRKTIKSMKISNQGLFLTTGLAILSIFGLNYWVYNVDFVSEKNFAWCAVVNNEVEDKYSVSIEFTDTEEESAYYLGENIFQANCTQCHAVHQQVVGPALKNVSLRWASETELIQFIKYPQKTIDAGKNAYASALFKKYKQYGSIVNLGIECNS
ncbi:MAG: cytochrome c2 [Arenicella sp.]|jgi:cytochrome c2